jgi:hypothetical protein
MREKKLPAFPMSHAFVRWLAALLVACIVLPVAESAAAEQKSSGRELESIRRRMEAGLALFVGTKYSEAAREFDTGYGEHPYSAFLFNAGVCYQKLGDKKVALDRYREYLRIDPSAPDVPTVQKRVAALEAELAPPTAPTPDAPPQPPPEAIPTTEDAMRSLVVVETEPAGAPIKVFVAESDRTPPWTAGSPNVGWREAASGSTPVSLSLAVGRFHLVVDKFRDFNVSETDLKVTAGHVYHFKANLSQGAFMAFLRVSSSSPGAHVWLDDVKKERPEWGATPFGELVAAGEHDVLVEAPGFQPLNTKIRLEHGEQKELEVRLVRVDYGILRVDSNSDDAKIQIDFEPRGVWRKGEPPFDVKVPAGKHRLTIESTDHKTYEGEIEVPRGQLVRVHAKMIEKYPRGAAWVEAVVAAVLVGTGTYLALESNKLHRQVEADRQAHVLDDGDSRVTKGAGFSIAADIAFVAAAGFAALSVYSFLEDPMPESTSKFEKPIDFDDPSKGETTAARREAPRVRVAKRQKRPAGNGLRVSAGATPLGFGGGVLVGGSF